MKSENGTFVVLCLSKLLNGSHQYVVIAKKLIQQKSTEAVTKTLAGHWIYKTHTHRHTFMIIAREGNYGSDGK